MASGKYSKSKRKTQNNTSTRNKQNRNSQTGQSGRSQSKAKSTKKTPHNHATNKKKAGTLADFYVERATALLEEECLLPKAQTINDTHKKERDYTRNECFYDNAHKTRRQNQQSTTDWEYEESLKMMAAKRDGIITGLILVFIMAAAFGIYMVLASINPEIGPQALGDKFIDVMLRWLIDLLFC